jgi:predicted GNAT family N-acyltransferase
MVVVSQGDSATLALEEIQRLRLMVWSPIIGPDLAGRRFSIDSLDREAWHVGVKEKGRLVACGRVSFHQCAAGLPDRDSFSQIPNGFAYPCCIMNRLVVDPRCRGKGLSTVIVDARMDISRQLGASEVWVEAQSNRLTELQRHGFETVCQSGDRTIVGDWWIFRRELQAVRLPSNQE